VRTIQGTIGAQLTKRFGTQISVSGAGRTDFGVHARGQVVHFDLPQPAADLRKLEYTLNRMLPDDIRLYNMSVVPPGNKEQVAKGEPFHATKSAIGKLYVYRFCTNSFVDPLRRRYCTHVYHPTSMSVYEDCMKSFIGTYDFQAFANRVEHNMREHEERNSHFTTIRTINDIKVIDEGGGYYRTEVYLESALYRMVRNMVGTSLLVANGGMQLETFKKLLEPGSDRLQNKAKPAPPEGLTLEHVYYDHY
jgi:tRNA pseudouridine38-40 synthase